MRRASLLAVFLSLPLGAAASEGPIVPKQLAGPPAEFAQLAPADPVAAAIQSRHALIALGPEGSARGPWTATRELPPMPAGARIAVFTLDGRVAVSLTETVRGRSEVLATARAQAEAAFGFDGMQLPAEVHTLVRRSEGPVRVSASGPAGSRGAWLLIEGDGPAELASFQTHRRQTVGDVVEIAALLTAVDAKETVLTGEAAGRIETARVHLTAPDGSRRELAMAAETLHPERAVPGALHARFVADRPGIWLASVEIGGRDAEGRAILRTAEHVIPVVADTLDLAGTRVVVDARSEPGAYRIGIPVTTTAPGQHYRVHAEVWGTDARGAEVPVAWVGGMVTPEAGLATVRLDGRWIALAGARAPFTLRALRIEDPDHFVELAAAERLPLPIAADGARKSRDPIVIDETMQMGPRPEGFEQAKNTGSRLLLVHGYCSGGVWPAAHFTNASTFLDVNQNRTNDQFARLIAQFGAQWNSFGVVAHSQGGLASLHLYNYYWSGLDRATGSRLIQSVGSPYRGTNLAGILATLGNWFGVGCGSNPDLTYSGAQAWLAGISSAARAKVNYYTTSFRTTNWWTNDYCQIATDLVLSDPEDGTVEQVNGQLAGAINRGHTTGQCHTDNMRDPAQYRDANRNAVMNANAAR